jgi:hypothetical protein
MIKRELKKVTFAYEPKLKTPMLITTLVGGSCGLSRIEMFSLCRFILRVAQKTGGKNARKNKKTI